MPRELKRRKLSVGPCEYCKKAETMCMVQCDDCDKWFHYHCAGVGPEIEHLNWSCYVCKNQEENLKTTEVLQGRHDDCKKQVLPKRKVNYLSSQSKNIETDDKRQIRELSQNLADLKIEIKSKNERIVEQCKMLEVQGKQIEGILDNVADLKTEIGSKNERIVEQRNMLEVQGKQIEGILNNVADLKTEIGSKNEGIVEQCKMLEVQGKQIEGILDNVADLKTEIGSKNERIVEQRNMLEVQGKQIEGILKNIAALQIEIQQKQIDNHRKPAYQQQGEHVKEVVDTEKEFDSVTVLGIFLNLMCDTKEELTFFGTKLRNPKLVCGLRDQFCIFGGDLKTFIVGMINRIMSKELQSQLTLSGKRTTKPGLADFSIVLDFIHLCCAKRFDKYDSKAGELIIQKHLQNV